MAKRTLKGLRCDLELSQKEFAEKIGCPLASYQRYERYEIRIPAEVAINIADLCKIKDVRDIKIK